LHFMTLHCFDEMVVRNQHFGTFSPKTSKAVRLTIPID